MHSPAKPRSIQRVVTAAVLLTGTLFFSLGGACEVATQYFDPCGTILANCTPGSFQLQFADVPDWNVDPGCTIPGGCSGDDPWEDPFGQLGPGFDGP